MKTNIISPYDGKVIGEVKEFTNDEVEEAINNAQYEFNDGEWSRYSSDERAQILFSIANSIEKNSLELATIESNNNGKVIKETIGEMKSIVDTFRYYGGMSNKISGETLPLDNKKFIYTQRKPLGVIAMITPWNSPLLMMAWKIAPALAAGNTVVLKPSEYTPLSSIKLQQLCLESGLPNGVLNIVTGQGNTVGNYLVSSDKIAKVSFTGSIIVGKKIDSICGNNLKPISMELGGKAPNIIFEDCNLDNAVRAAVKAAFGGQGHSCSAGSRIFVQKSIENEFIEKFIKLTKKIKIGDPLNMETEYGPISNTMQLEKVVKLVEVGLKEGATLAYGGKRIEDPAYRNGLFFYPTIFTNVDSNMTIAQEEIFGPVVSILAFDDESQLIKDANSVKYGLSGAIWTKDINRALRLNEKLEMGTLWINCYKQISCKAPYGGMKSSGYGRENGKMAVDEFCQTKTVVIDYSDQVSIWYEGEKEE